MRCFSPATAPRPTSWGKGIANPSAMILSTAMMLDWLADKHDYAPAGAAAQRIEAAVDRAFQAGIKPREFGGPDGTAAVAKAVLSALD